MLVIFILLLFTGLYSYLYSLLNLLLYGTNQNISIITKNNNIKPTIINLNIVLHGI